MNENQMPDMGDLSKMIDDPEFKDFMNNFTQGLLGSEGGEGAEGFDPSKFGEMGGDPEKMMETLMKQMSGFMEENEDNPELKNTMESMMNDMLKKDSMYPPMKMLKEELPKFLEENVDNLDPADLERYNNQLDIVEEVCKIYEFEGEENNESVTQLLFRLQEFGSPPEALVNKMQQMQTSSLQNMVGGGGGFPGMGAFGNLPGFS